MRNSRLYVLALLFSLTACRSLAPYVVTGEALKLSGEQFLATAALMDKGYDARLITAEQYRNWAAFGVRFQAGWPLARQLWEVARKTNDAALEGRMIEVLTIYAGELGAFYAQALELTAALRPAVADGGSP